jgi:hypothetical protein
MLDGIPSANNFDPLLVGAYDALLEDIDKLAPDEQLAVVERLNVGILLTPTSRRDLDEVGYAAPIYAYRIPNPWPRVSVADCRIRGGDEQCTPRDGARAEIVLDQPLLMVVHVSADQPGSLLVLDTYYPGWGATVDGQRAEVRSVNAVFRAVDIPAGEHEVVMAYRPMSLRFGAGLTFASLVVVAALWFFPRKPHA